MYPKNRIWTIVIEYPISKLGIGVSGARASEDNNWVQYANIPRKNALYWNATHLPAIYLPVTGRIYP